MYICFVYMFACAWAHMSEWKCTCVRSYGDPRLWSGNILHCSSIFPTEAGPLSQAQIWLRLFLPAALSWPFLSLSFWGSDYRWTTPLQSLHTCWASVLWSSCLVHTLTNCFPASVSNILDGLAFVPVGNYSHHHMEPASSINIHVLSTIFSKLSCISLFPLFFIFFQQFHDWSAFKNIYFYFVCGFPVKYVCMCSHLCVVSVGSEEDFRSPRTGLQIVVSHRVGARNWTRSSERATSSLNCGTISLGPNASLLKRQGPGLKGCVSC